MTERTVPFTKEQWAILQEGNLAVELAGELLASSFVNIAQELASKQQEFWASVYRLADADMIEDHVTIDWVRCELRVARRRRTDGDK